MDMFLENSLRSDSEAKQKEIRIRFPPPPPRQKKVSDLPPVKLDLCLQIFDLFENIFYIDSLLIYAYAKDIHVIIFSGICPRPTSSSFRNVSQVSGGAQAPLVAK